MCIDIRILAAFIGCFISFLAGMVVTDGKEDCDKKSQFWNNVTYSALADTCKPLAYEEQYCLVDDDKWECMRQRALMHDTKSCKCHQNPSYSSSYGCLYVEFCTFADPDFKCDSNYNCSLDKDDVIRCTAPNLPLYTNHCRRSFIHCTRNESCDFYNYQTKYDDILTGECGKTLTDAFGTDVTIYFIDQVHFNGSSAGFASIFTLILAEGDKDNPCKKGIQADSLSTNQDWKIVVPILIVFISTLLLSFGGWKFRQIRIRDNELLNNTFESLSKKIINTEESVEREEGDPTNDVEVADLISPGGIQLPAETESNGVSETPHSAPSNEYTITQPPGVNEMSQISSDAADRNRGFSFENSSYTQGSRLHPSTSSVGSVSGGYSSKNDPGIVDALCNGFTEKDPVSGYSLKSSSALDGSASQCSSSNSRLIPNTVSHQANRQDSSSDLNSRVFPDSKDMDNPTYLL